MRLGIILASFNADLKSFGRSKGTLFWTLAFPVMLILIFGAIFSGADEAEYELFVIDYDESEMSNLTINVLEETGIIKAKIVDVSEDNILSYIEENDKNNWNNIFEKIHSDRVIGVVRSLRSIPSFLNLVFRSRLP